MIFAKLTNEIGERLTVVVEQRPLGFFDVYVDGGVLANGRDHEECDTLEAAMARAAAEMALILREVGRL